MGRFVDVEFPSQQVGVGAGIDHRRDRQDAGFGRFGKDHLELVGTVQPLTHLGQELLAGDLELDLRADRDRDRGGVSEEGRQPGALRDTLDTGGDVVTVDPSHTFAASAGGLGVGEHNVELVVTDVVMPGMTGNAWFDATELPRSPGGLVQADAHCRIAGWPGVYVVGDSGSFPGPDWMPKQAHMADLQARAAAVNLLADLEGRPSTVTFKVELICIVDAVDQGTLIYRTATRNIMLPSSRLFHWAKRAFEKRYLQQYR